MNDDLPNELLPQRKLIALEHTASVAEILKSPIIVILLNVIVAGVMTFINFAFITGRYTERFSGLERRTATIEVGFKMLNEQGTVASQLQLAKDAEKFGSFVSRLSLMEPQVAKIPVMLYSIDRLEADVRELQGAHRKMP